MSPATRYADRVATRPCTCCGLPLAAGTDVCPRCNTDVVQRGPSSRDAKMALALGLLGLAVLPVVFSVPAIVFALRARRTIARTPGMHGRNAAGWGLAMGIFGTILGGLLVMSFVIGLNLPGG
jgi:uncharacterized paraquat-inducible protein A